MLVVGDSVSNGYFSALKRNLSASHQVVHAPGNNDNTNWGHRCLRGWLGADRARWDVVAFNFGLHDLAYPDNEHLPLEIYARLLGNITAQLRADAPRARLIWATTTPVPTDPPPEGGKPCTLIPGRLESSVLAYNRAAAGVIAAHRGVAVCDLHGTQHARARPLPAGSCGCPQG